ncbi:MAG: nitroreductase family protein, partial [Candidatus Fermentibacteria bacterium]|nr:nitroreductase family protein [Candidatus Fermentibacteria bacterium]
MLDAIRERRSIRKYQNKPVPAEKLETLLRAAMQAPSARNTQPWEFVITEDRDILSRIPDFHPYAGMVPSAGAAILVCGNRELQGEISYILEDCSAAIQNILLEAVNQDIGAVWLGVYPREDRIQGMINLFNLPAHIVPIALISLGFPAEK